MNRRRLLALAGAAGLVSPRRGLCGLPDVWDAHCDVLIAGGGAAGLSAAIEAAECGGRVLLFEKASQLGGDTLISSGTFSAVDPARQKRQGIEDSFELFARQILESGGGLNTPEMAGTLARESTRTLEWLEGLGMVFLPEVTEIYGSRFPRVHASILPSGTGYIKTLSEAALSRGVKIQAASPVLDFVVDDRTGRVTGALVSVKGKTLAVEARRGVVVACGGFGASRDMRRRWIPETAELPTDSQPGATGELLLKAQEAGAKLVNMDSVECVPGASPALSYSIRLDYTPSLFIFVNAEGRRFVDETLGRRTIAEAILREMNKGPCFCVSGMAAVESLRVHWRKNLLRGLYAGEAWREKTPEALALAVGLPPETLSEEIRRAAGERSLDRGPFWAARIFLHVHHTLGGIRIDTRGRALDSDGNPVPGLFAAGEAAGSVHGRERIAATGIPSACAFGRIAGRSAMDRTL